MSAFQVALGCLASYLLGAIPVGYLIARFAKGIDIREYGSGNPGATNVLRVVGRSAGVATFLLDFFKGWVPVFLALRASHHNEYFGAAVGLAAIAGHNWTCFLKWKGGKGVATSAGVFMALVPIPACVALGVFALGFLTSRHVSIGSMAGAISMPASVWLYGGSRFLVGLSFFCAALIIFMHKKNIVRLLEGREHKIHLR